MIGALLLLVGGTFCWDETPGATSYRLYATAVGTIEEVTDPETGETRTVTATPLWSLCLHGEFSYDNCAQNTCCVYVVDRPEDLVYYFVTAANAAGESPRPTPNEPCP